MRHARASLYRACDDVTQTKGLGGDIEQKAKVILNIGRT